LREVSLPGGSGNHLLLLPRRGDFEKIFDKADGKMLGQVVYELVLSTLNWPFASAVASVLVLCQLLVLIANFRIGRRA
jgi:ABC-type spermidine/putrescine transport system permease subunit I